MLDTRKIKGRMVELGLSQKDIAKELGIAQATASQKINGVRPLYLSEARKLSELLHIESGEFGKIFFGK